MMELLVETAQLLALLFIAFRVSGGGTPNPPPERSTETIYDVLGETDVVHSGTE
jgi:hypothetical protein